MFELLELRTGLTVVELFYRGGLLVIICFLLPICLYICYMILLAIGFVVGKIFEIFAL